VVPAAFLEFRSTARVRIARMSAGDLAPAGDGLRGVVPVFEVITVTGGKPDELKKLAEAYALMPTGAGRRCPIDRHWRNS
jgi:hypothetical protein